MVVLFLSCGGEKSKPEANPTPGDAVVAYYNMLMSGNIEGCVRSMSACDSIPAFYREWMSALLKQHCADLAKANGGLASVNAVEQQMMPGGRSAQVHLQLRFHDGTSEVVLVQTVLKGKEWRIR